MNPRFDPKTTQRLHDLMREAVEPPNAFVAYHVDQARAARDELETLTQSIAKAGQHLDLLKQKDIELRARLAVHLESIAAWPGDGEPQSGP